METSSFHGRNKTLSAALVAALLIAAPGCGTETGGQRAAETPAASDAEPAKKPAATAARKTAPVSKEDERLGTRTDRVRLKDAGCVEFDPHWVILSAGQSLTWTSDLKSPVTIHVSAGAFDRSEFTVRPGASVSSGPARAAGTFTIWTSPAACQGPPLGVRGSGPGVTVEAASH